LLNTIVADNTAGGGNPDLSGTFNADFTLIETPGSAAVIGADNIIGTDPQLGPLQNNGGPTLTHEPAANAPPVETGDLAFVPPPNFDQRGAGFARVVGARTDMGAVERNPVPVELLGLSIE
jgi:hypothetical protein